MLPTQFPFVEIIDIINPFSHGFQNDKYMSKILTELVSYQTKKGKHQPNNPRISKFLPMSIFSEILNGSNSINIWNRKMFFFNRSEFHQKKCVHCVQNKWSFKGWCFGSQYVLWAGPLWGRGTHWAQMWHLASRGLYQCWCRTKHVAASIAHR